MLKEKTEPMQLKLEGESNIELSDGTKIEVRRTLKANLIVRKALNDKTDLYSEKDYDYWIKVIKNGAVVQNNPSACCMAWGEEKSSNLIFHMSDHELSQLRKSDVFAGFDGAGKLVSALKLVP